MSDLTPNDLAQKALADIGKLAGHVVRVKTLNVLTTDGSDTIGGWTSDTPVVLKIEKVQERDNILRWSEMDVIDPIYKVTLFEPHPDFTKDSGRTPSYIYGTSYSLDGTEKAGDILEDLGAVDAYLEAKVVRDFEALAGHVVLVTRLNVVQDRDGHEDISEYVCETPVKLVINKAPSTIVDQDVIRWMDDDVIDPTYSVSLFEPHPEFGPSRDPYYIYGTSYYTDGRVESGDIIENLGLAPEEPQPEPLTLEDRIRQSAERAAARAADLQANRAAREEAEQSRREAFTAKYAEVIAYLDGMRDLGLTDEQGCELTVTNQGNRLVIGFDILDVDNETPTLLIKDGTSPAQALEQATAFVEQYGVLSHGMKR
jgi:hypothetical protein